MKSKARTIWFVVLCALLVANPKFAALAQAQTKSQTLGTMSPQAARKMVGAQSRAVIAALKKRDMIALSRYVHPQLGLRFSPYSTVQKSDRAFPIAQVRRLNQNKTRYLWGSYDGTGDPIRLTWNAYYKEFVFPHDYTRAPKTQYNSDIVSGYTSAIRDFYPKAIFVRYLFPGFNPKYEGMDWRGLWLVWNRSGNGWKLVGIANDQWTI
jgi:hypothetical protein